MGTSGTESCEGCPQTQFKHLPPQLALESSLVRLNTKPLSYRTNDENSPSNRLSTLKCELLFQMTE